MMPRGDYSKVDVGRYRGVDDERPSPPVADDEVERVAKALKTWKFAAPMLDGYRICGVVRDGDTTSFPWKTFESIEEASAELDRLNARAALAASDREVLVKTLEPLLKRLDATVTLEAIGRTNSKYSEGRRDMAKLLLPVVSELRAALIPLAGGV